MLVPLLVRVGVLASTSMVVSLISVLLYEESSIAPLIMQPSSQQLLVTTTTMSGTVVGLLYPSIDSWWDNRPRTQDWGTVFRALLGFLGIIMSIAKLEASSAWEVSFALSMISVSIWWLVDGTRVGLAFSTVVMLVHVFAAQILAMNGAIKWQRPTFFFIDLSVCPLLFMATTVCGVLGRRLARSFPLTAPLPAPSRPTSRPSTPAAPISSTPATPTRLNQPHTHLRP
eukprot:m.213142 g.213142  ORF g.213142 m.213142 type:complete len:228 (-) comp15081_c0_seq1:2001-2684(-)